MDYALAKLPEGLFGGRCVLSCLDFFSLMKTLYMFNSCFTSRFAAELCIKPWGEEFTDGCRGWGPLALILQYYWKFTSEINVVLLFFVAVSAEVCCDICLGVLLCRTGGADLLSCGHLGWGRGWDHRGELQQGLQVRRTSALPKVPNTKSVLNNDADKWSCEWSCIVSIL